MRRHPHNQVTGLQAGFLHNCLASYSMHLLSAPSRISLQVTITKPNVTSLIVFQLHQELQRLRPGPTQKPKGTPRVSVQNRLCSLIDSLPISVSCFPTQPALSPIQQHPVSQHSTILKHSRFLIPHPPNSLSAKLPFPSQRAQRTLSCYICP